MTQVLGVVQSSTHLMVPATVQVPGIVSVFTSIILRIRFIWSWYRWGKVYTNENNWYKLVAGHVVNLAIGDNIVLRIAAQCILIASKIFKCVNGMVALSRACHVWVDTVKGNFSSHHSLKKVSAAYESSKQGCCQSTCEAIWERIKRIAIATFHVLRCMFKLSMYFMDAIESFYISPATRNEGINELFVNATSVIDNFVKNLQRLEDMMEDNQKLINHILIGIGSTYTAAVLIDAISKALATAETVQTVANAGGGVVRKTIKHAVFGMATMIGVAKHLPLSVVPTEDDDQLLPAQKPLITSSRPSSTVLRSNWSTTKAAYMKI